MNMDKEKKLKFYTYKLNMTTLNILAIFLYIIVGILVYFIEHLDNYSINLSLTSLFILMFIWLIIHELLHGIGFAIF